MSPLTASPLSQGETPATPRPPLRAIPLADVLPIGSRPGVIVTMSIGQWDAILAASYSLGFVLLELDDEERPVRAYAKNGGDS